MSDKPKIRYADPEVQAFIDASRSSKLLEKRVEKAMLGAIGGGAGLATSLVMELPGVVETAKQGEFCKFIGAGFGVAASVGSGVVVGVVFSPAPPLAAVLSPLAAGAVSRPAVARLAEDACKSFLSPSAQYEAGKAVRSVVDRLSFGGNDYRPPEPNLWEKFKKNLDPSEIFKFPSR